MTCALWLLVRSCAVELLVCLWLSLLFYDVRQLVSVALSPSQALGEPHPALILFGSGKRIDSLDHCFLCALEQLQTLPWWSAQLVFC